MQGYIIEIPKYTALPGIGKLALTWRLSHFVASILNGSLELGKIRLGRIEGDGCLAFVQRDIDAGNASNWLQDIFDATHATHAGHAFDINGDGFHIYSPQFNFAVSTA